MIAYHCIVKHDPPNSYGDCLRACIASITNAEKIDDVPHFYRDGDDERAQIEFRHWLWMTHNIRPFYVAMPSSVSLEDIFAMMTGVNTDVEYLLFCQCSGGDHVVICRNDAMTHNPSWDNASISGPCENGFWVIVVMVRA